MSPPHASTSEARLRVVRGGALDHPHDVTDRLLDRATSGDVGAWSRLYQDHFDGLLRFVSYSTGDVAAAEDLVQEAFALALVGLAKFDRRSSFATWIRAIATNLVRKHWRDRQRRSRAYARLEEIAKRLAPPSSTRPDKQVQLDRRADALLLALETLPSHLREAFVLSDVHDLSASEAAAALGISPGNLRVRATRARSRLRDQFARLGLLGDDGRVT